MKILIAGDFCPQYRVAELIEKSCFETVLGDVKDIIGAADYTIVNFECAVTKGGEKPIEKLGPNLCCSERGIEAVKWAGFDCMTLANNHFYDYGEEGVKNTFAACEKYSLDVVGGGNNIMGASKTLYKKINGETLAIINCCEHEFSIAAETKGGSNPLNPIQQYYAIQEAKQHADYVLLIMHGGHERFQLPSPRMQEFYRFFVDAGADAIVNHHQHCYSGYEIYQGKPIFYGLGNFCFDNVGHRDDNWNEGYMVMIEMGQPVKYDLMPYQQCRERACVKMLDAHSFDEKIKELNAIIGNPQELKEVANSFYESCIQAYCNILEPLQNRYYLGMKRHGWLPSFITLERKTRAHNYICCESHRDILTYYFEK